MAPPAVGSRVPIAICWRAFVDRDLYFQAFDPFYRAFQGFLLGLHVSRRTYPLDYNKWIREQVAENLALPELYRSFPTTTNGSSGWNAKPNAKWEETS